MRNELFNQCIQSIQHGKNITHAQIAAKRQLREELEVEMEKYLARGGQIKQAVTQFKPKPTRTVVRSKKDAYASSMQELRILNWCNAGDIKRPRRTALAELSGVPLSRIRSCITSGNRSRITKAEYAKFSALIPVIEANEKGVKA